MILRTSILLFLILFRIQLFGQTFKIDFLQGSQTFRGDSTRVIKLKKEPFVIAVELDSLDGIFVNCSERPVIAYGAMKRNIPYFSQIGSMVSVEAEFNRDQELFLNYPNDFCYWFYDPKEYDWHRFDSVIVRKGSSIIGTKTVRQFYSLEQDKNLTLKEVPKKLYLTFFSINGSFNEENAVLNQVQTYQLIFVD
jgi:hypothetical protein